MMKAGGNGLFGKLLLLFIAVPLLDLTLLLVLADRLTWQVTVAIVVASGILGAALASWQGRLARGRIDERLRRGQLPTGGQISDGAMILVAAALLVTPGVITDLFGLSLLIPPVRTFYKSLLRRWFQTRMDIQVWSAGGGASPPEEPSQVVEGEVVSRERPTGNRADRAPDASVDSSSAAEQNR